MVKLPNQLFGQEDFASKSHVDLGVRKPFLAAVTTTAILTKPPISDGNSGPKNIPVNAYGMVKAMPAKMAKGRISKPSFQLLFLPKKRVNIITINNGMKVPTIPWITAT